MDDQVQKYIEYIDRQYGRRAEKQKSTGFSMWLVYTAMAYLASNLISLIKIVEGDVGISIRVFCFSIYFISFLSFFSKPPKRVSTFNKFDYRFSVFPIGFFQLSLGLILLTIPFVLFLLFGNDFEGVLVGYSSKVLVVIPFEFCCICILAIFLFFHMLNARNYTQATGYPHPLIISKENSGAFYGWMEIVFKWFLFLMVLANFIGLIATVTDFYLSVDDDKKFSNVVTFGFISAILLCLVHLAFRSVTSKDEVFILNRLDRDIVLHNLTAQEIKLRIETDLLGDRELIPWLKSKVGELKTVVQTLTEQMNRAEEVKSEIDGIDPQYGIEKDARMRAYLGNIKEETTCFLVETRKLIDWLKKLELQAQLSHDKTLVDILLQETSELEGFVENISTQVDKVFRVFGINQ